MWTGLEKCVGKYDLSKGGLGLGRRWVFELLIFSFLFCRNLKHKGVIVLSPESFKTGGAFSRTADLYRKLSLLSKKINESIELVDPVFFDALTQLHRKATAKHASLAAWRSVDPLLLEGRELLLNRISGRHCDHQDPKLAYAGLYAAGNFKLGGYIFFPSIKPSGCVYSLVTLSSLEAEF